MTRPHLLHIAPAPEDAGLDKRAELRVQVAGHLLAALVAAPATSASSPFPLSTISQHDIDEALTIADALVGTSLRVPLPDEDEPALVRSLPAVTIAPASPPDPPAPVVEPPVTP